MQLRPSAFHAVRQCHKPPLPSFGTSEFHVPLLVVMQNVLPSRPTSLSAVLIKLALDQLVMTPVGMCAFFASLRLMDKGTPAEAVEDIRHKLKPILTANYMLWPFANFVNFAFVPPEQRVLYINGIYVSTSSASLFLRKLNSCLLCYC